MKLPFENTIYSAFEQSPELHANGVGLVRYALAFMVVLHHFGGLTGTDIHSPVDIRAVVGGFFALSGFFAFRSFRRTSSGGAYLKARIRRLYPPYAGIIVFCALLMVLLSDYSVGIYFTDAGFWKYLVANLCFLNYLQPTLPGVFDGWSVPVINGSLWFMKIEIVFTLSVPWLFLIAGRWPVPDYKFFSKSKRTHFSDGGKCRVDRCILLVYFLVLGLCLFLSHQAVLEVCFDIGRHLLFYLWFFLLFLLGGLFYEKYRFFVRFRFSGAIVCVVILLLRNDIYGYDLLLQPFVIPWLLFCAAFALHGRLAAVLNILNRHNISYGIFLVHFPVIQVLRHVSGGLLPVWAFFFVTVIMTFLLAELFHRYLECPFISHKKIIQ